MLLKNNKEQQQEDVDVKDMTGNDEDYLKLGVKVPVNKKIHQIKETIDGG